METLKSVYEAISEFGGSIPVYVYDDHSQDDSYGYLCSIAEKYVSIVIRRNDINAGERTTTNRAFNDLKESTDWVFIIHADDIVKVEWLLELVKRIEQADQEKCFTVWSSFDSFDHDTGVISKGDDSGRIQDIERDYIQKKSYLTKLSSSWHISGAALNMLLFQKLGGFDIRLAQYGDTDFFVKGLLMQYSDIYLSRTLTLYRVIKGSVTHVSFRTNRDVDEIYLLLDKYSSILNIEEKSEILKKVRNTVLRRLAKGFLRTDKSVINRNISDLLFSFNYKLNKNK